MNFLLLWILSITEAPWGWGFRQGSHIIIFCIYEPSVCCVQNELEEGKSRGGRWVTVVVQARDDGDLGQVDGGHRLREVDDWEDILEVDLYLGFVDFEVEGCEKGENQAWFTGCEC